LTDPYTLKPIVPVKATRGTSTIFFVEVFMVSDIDGRKPLPVLWSIENRKITSLTAAPLNKFSG
jgi:hypothetical protein